MTDIKPGLHTIPIEDYHAGPGISKTGLWTLYTRTPFHYRYGERKETAAQAFGRAAHVAILEPELFETQFSRGPADRRGNKWTAAAEIAAATGRSLLTEDDYDSALFLRDQLARDPTLQRLLSGNPAIEQSAYALDPVTGQLVRVRPDLYNYPLRVMLDLKSTTDASLREWQKRVAEHGFHFQEAFYTDVWGHAHEQAGMTLAPVDAFVFLVVEREPPHAHVLYELDPAAVEEGRAAYRQALDLYHECVRADKWPAHPAGVQAIDLPRWAYKHTQPRSGE